MLDKYTVQIDAGLFKRFVEAIERIAPPPPKVRDPHSSTGPIGEEDDLISLSDADYARVDLQAQLDDLVDTLTEKGYSEANKDELAKLSELKGRLAEADMETLNDPDED